MREYDIKLVLWVRFFEAFPWFETFPWWGVSIAPRWCGGEVGRDNDHDMYRSCTLIWGHSDPLPADCWCLENNQYQNGLFYLIKN